MEYHFELSDHSKVATTSAQGPKQLGVLFPIGVHHGTVRCYQSEAFNVVDREPMQPGEPAKSAAENQPSGSRVRDYARGENKSLLLSGDVDRAEQAAARKPTSTSLAVDRYVSHS
jgi:hypothetical protein